MRSKGSWSDGYTPKTLEDCKTAPNESLAELAAIMASNKPMTIRQILAKTKISRTTIRTHLDFLMHHKLVHICRWDRAHTHVYAAVFKAGNKPNAAAPEMESALKVKEPPKKVEVKEPPKPLEDRYFSDLAAALVPKRNPDEQRQVNWEYMEYIHNQQAA